jgi:hypothetical protein
LASSRARAAPAQPLVRCSRPLVCRRTYTNVDFKPTTMYGDHKVHPMVRAARQPPRDAAARAIRPLSAADRFLIALRSPTNMPSRHQPTRTHAHPPTPTSPPRSTSTGSSFLGTSQTRGGTRRSEAVREWCPVNCTSRLSALARGASPCQSHCQQWCNRRPDYVGAASGPGEGGRLVAAGGLLRSSVNQQSH